MASHTRRTKTGKTVYAPTGNWNETSLWKAITLQESAESESVRTCLNLWLPKIQTILKSANTSPTAFTLHDADHAFRVAQKMVDITHPDVFRRLSVYEYALLLLSAYLHDIGMTPEEKKVNQHFEYLLTGKTHNLNATSIDAFQRWLDDDERGISCPLAEGAPTPEILQVARETITHYCRARHNDWSEDWIRRNMNGEKLGQYSDWIQDLVTLCLSHNEGKKKSSSRCFQSQTNRRWREFCEPSLPSMHTANR